MYKVDQLNEKLMLKTTHHLISHFPSASELCNSKKTKTNTNITKELRQIEIKPSSPPRLPQSLHPLSIFRDYVSNNISTGLVDVNDVTFHTQLTPFRNILAVNAEISRFYEILIIIDITGSYSG